MTDHSHLIPKKKEGEEEAFIDKEHNRTKDGEEKVKLTAPELLKNMMDI